MSRDRSIVQSFLIFFLSCCSIPALSNTMDLKFQTVELQNGRNAYTISDIFQDRDNFIWLATVEGLIRFDGYDYKVYTHQPDNPNSLSHNSVNSIIQDEQGTLWIGTRDGLDRFDPETETFEHFTHDPHANSLSDNFVRDLWLDVDQTLWIGTNSGTLDRYDPVTSKFYCVTRQFNMINEIGKDASGNLWIATDDWLYRYDFKDSSFTQYVPPGLLSNQTEFSNIEAIFIDQDDTIWFGTWGNGFFKLDPQKNEFHHYCQNNTPGLGSDIVEEIVQDDLGRLWIGTRRGGLSIYHPETQILDHYTFDPNNPSGIQNNSVNLIYQIRSGIVFLALFNFGLTVTDPQETNVHLFSSLNRNGFDSKKQRIQTMLHDQDNNWWLGTVEHGLFKHEPISKTTRFISIDPDDKVNAFQNTITDIIQDKNGSIWLATSGSGLKEIDPATESVTHFIFRPGASNSISNNYLTDLAEDQNGSIWISCWGGIWGAGLNHYDPRSKSFTHYSFDPQDSTSISDNDVICLYVDRSNTLWIGTQNGGLNRFLPDSRSFIRFKQDVSDSTSLSANYVTAIFQDHHGVLWIGTYNGGLNRINSDAHTFDRFTDKDGLAGNYVYDIFSDRDGQLWILTNNGFCEFDAATNTFQKHAEIGTLFGRAGQDRDGLIYIMNEHGVHSFDPGEIQQSIRVPSVLLTEFSLFNEPVTVGKNENTGFVLNQAIEHTNKLVLSYKQNNFSLKYAAVEFFNQSRYKYLILLRGYDTDWRSMGSQRLASYLNVPPGHYSFLVKVSNEDGLWSNEHALVDIKVTPPFWKTVWAYILYSLLFVLAVISIYRFLLFRQRIKYELILEKNAHQLDLKKMQFFANISHEMRTPLTLITAPLEKILKQADDFLDNKDLYLLMQKNVQRLVRLVNQALDFRKFDYGKLKLELSRGDIIQFIRSVSALFEELAHEKELDYSLDFHPEFYMVWFDPDKLEKILFNLLSNAVKFTPKGGAVHLAVRIQDHALSVRVKDTGIGFPQAEQSLIFYRFYQIDSHSHEGSGIGLAYVKECVDLYRGQIQVNSEVNKGSVFTITIPLHHEAEFEMLEGHAGILMNALSEDDVSVSDDREEPPDLTLKTGKKAIILVVDDNAELRRFIRHELEMDYAVFEAQDGDSGFALAEKYVPDLIISDIMMPGMDGYAFCEAIRKNVLTSHIPIILLTARTALDSQIKGLEIGADDYIPKPFSMDILKAKITNSIESRNKLLQHFRREVVFSPKETVVSSVKDEFIERIISIIEQNMEEPEFDAESLSRQSGFSRSQLYRKIKDYSGETVNSFIRIIRLKRATVYLKAGKNVSETAYLTGFTAPTHFSTYFKEYFGITPTQFGKVEHPVRDA